MDYKLTELIDIQLLQNLQTKLNSIYSFPSAIIDNDGNVLVAVAWQDLCTKFHRKHPLCEKECIKSDLYILDHLHDAKPAVTYVCPHGLVDNALPIIIDGIHLGNFFTGQFFLEKPDLAFFKKQAGLYGFDEAAYLEAVERVPIWTKEKLSQYLDFIKDFIEIIAGIGLNQLKQFNAIKAIREREERNHAIVQSTHDWIWEIDKNGNYCYSSDKVERILGYTAVEIMGKSPFDLMPEDGREHIGNIFRDNLLQKKSIVDLENWKLHKDGHKVCLLTNGFPITDETGEIIGYRGADKDITERKLAEAELVKAKEQAEESDRLKSAFLANMSHEIRTPMNGILGFAELLKEPDLTSEEQLEYIQIIEKSGARMLNIINDIIDISKIESGLIKLTMEESNINEQIEYIYNFFKPEVEAKGIKLSIGNTLPSKEATIYTDHEKLYAILTNLVKNAIKFTNEGSIEFGYNLVETHDHVETHDRVETHDHVETHGRASLQFFVKDTGIGIPKDKLDAIFERFIQADMKNVKARQGAGLGLGLAITKSYVELLGGTIWAESRNGEGSTFYFTLPYTLKPADIQLNKKPLSIQNKEAHAIMEGRDLKILIVEDDTPSVMLLSLIVRLLGKNILKARNGLEAIEVCRNNPDIGLILMDIQMPFMGGYEATRIIRQFNKEVIIIAQTAYGLTNDREKALAAGCNDYISKPIDKNLLLEVILRHLTDTEERKIEAAIN